MEHPFKNISKMYDKLTYFDQYGGSVLLFFIITIILILVISYFHTLINIQPIINDWPNQRCKPNILPFAGLINPPQGVSATDYTSQNFTYCTQNILSNITGYAVEPISFVTNTLQQLANNMQNSIQGIRAMFDKVRSSMQNVSEEIMGRLINVMVPLQQIIISFKDLISKIQGTMTAGLFTLLGSYYTLKSLMGAIAQFIITILITLAAMIAAFWIFPFTWGAAIANTAIFVAIAIPMAIILAFMNQVLHVKTGGIPKIKCFDKNTLIKMNDGTYRKISHIEPGEILIDNNEVTSIIKVTTEGSQMFILNNVIVSDSHIVHYNNKWIKVSQHPYAKKYDNYKEPFLYCLNTNKKIININNTIFTDWDELYDDKLSYVVNNSEPILKTKKDKQTSYIHTYLDSGFQGNTPIKMSNGSYKHLQDIQINDILENGEKVYGVVQINGQNIIQQYKYHLGDDFYVYGYDYHWQFDNVITNKHNKLYHILTDKGMFNINKTLLIHDYNYAIDRFLP